jgi:uncharacterized membrane protein HdeD (DUF308 family)
MDTNNKFNKPPPHGDLAVQLIEAITNALAKLLTTGTSTVVALGILVILTAIILQANPEVQQQMVPLLTGMLGVIIGRMLAQGGTQPPEPPGTPGSSK